MSAIRSLFARLPIDRYLALLVATIAFAALLPARGEAAAVVGIVVKLAVAALFLLYGARLHPEAIWRGLSHWHLQGVVFGSTYVLFPLIGLALGYLVRDHLPSDIMAGILFLCLLPSTVQSSIAFTSIARGNVPAALCSASLSNLVGVALTPLLVSQLLPVASGGFSLKAFGDIVIQILIPFAAGQAIRPWVGAWVRRHPVMTTIVDRGSILVVVYAAFSAGMVAGIWGQLSMVNLAAVLALDLLILAIAIIVTTSGSRWLGFSREDEIAIVFCGSKKSMASGIPMAAILFPGHAIGLIVLPLMLFHQAQLFVCALLARRYAQRKDAADALAVAPASA